MHDPPTGWTFVSIFRFPHVMHALYEHRESLFSPPSNISSRNLTWFIDEVPAVFPGNVTLLGLSLESSATSRRDADDDG